MKNSSSHQRENELQWKKKNSEEEHLENFVHKTCN